MAVNSNPPVQLDPSQDQGHQIAFINQNFQSLANSLNPFILSDGSNNRLLIGKDSTGSYVVKVSKAGFDAFNTPDANLIFNSNQDIFKIAQSGTASIPSAAIGTSQLVTVTHNLGLIPAVIAFATYGINNYPLPFMNIQNTGIDTGKVAILIDIENITTTTLQFVAQFNNINGFSGSTGIVPVKYYLLQEVAS